MLKNLLLAMTCAVAFTTFAQPSAPAPIVKTPSGIVRGALDSDVFVFKGIPYAAPPVGSLRWRQPQQLAAWPGVRDATKFCADCAQMGFPPGGDSISKSASEDCLFLNIWTPTSAKKNTKLAVMVWIHGGAFVFGSGAQPDFSGATFARQGVVLVTINYRLGRLGFFAFPALTQEHPEESKGSYAYMDQIAALQWVQKNIAAFGGDPKNVTIFGESAGGVSVHSLMTIPSAKGLFQKAISESGGGRDGVLTGRPLAKDNADSYYPVSAETIGVNFARKHGIAGTDTTALAKLRALTVAQIIDGGQETYGSDRTPIYPGPILDGKLVVETAEAAYRSGHQAPVALMIGNNSAEVPVGFVNAASKDQLFALFGKMKTEAAEVYAPDSSMQLSQALTLVNTDKVWGEPARMTARAFAAKGLSAYVYLFSYVSPGVQQMMRYGAGHGSEIPYVFGNPHNWNGSSSSPKDFEVARMANTYWVNFAKNGDPNGGGLPMWSRYDPAIDQILEFKADGTAGTEKDGRKARLDVIESAVTSKNLH